MRDCVPAKTIFNVLHLALYRSLVLLAYTEGHPKVYEFELNIEIMI